MFKIIYIVGGIIIFFTLIAIIAPTPESKIANNIVVEKKEIAVATITIATTTTSTNAAAEIFNTSTESVVDNPNNKIASQVAEVKIALPEKQTSSTITRVNPQYEYYSVSNIVDGDTIKVNINGAVETLRLIGIDTPETVDPRKPVQCFGREASNKAKDLLSGQNIRIEKDPTQGDLDKYGRLLAYVYREDGLFFNKYMIEQGYAHEYTYDTPYKYQTEFKEAETDARENQLGLWSPSACNGDTTSEATSSKDVTTTTQTAGKYYTSSYFTAKYYYPVACSAWQGLSKSYLKAFDSLEALLNAYPARTLSPQCQ